MTEIPEHLRKRAEKARRWSLGKIDSMLPPDRTQLEVQLDKDLAFFSGGRPVRPDWDEYFLAIAKAVSARADCRRAQHGAIIVQNHRIVATGYNGAPAGAGSCLAGDCPRGLLTSEQVAHLTPDYSNCIACHAEQNAIAYASRADTEGAVIYITGAPCDMCSKLIKAAGIVSVRWHTAVDG